MMKDIFYEKLRRLLEEENEEETHMAPAPTPTPNNQMITKPKKRYVVANDILTSFGITKEAYNNLLVCIKFNS